jgi:hypothetical protein
MAQEYPPGRTEGEVKENRSGPALIAEKLMHRKYFFSALRYR